jgi:ribonuclease HII
MRIVGVDENGLGPLLGPLVTTAVVLETSAYSAKKHARMGRSVGIDDSKATAGFKKMETAESLTLALVERLCGRVSAHVDELFAALLLDSRDVLVAPCPEGAHKQCWASKVELPCFGGDLEEGRAMLDKLEKKGVKVERVQSAVACTGVLNTRLDAGQSRVEVDLELMERLVLAARKAGEEEVLAICGMVGGIRNYPARMRHLPRHGLTPLAAPKNSGTLAFQVGGVGKVSFEIDADANHLPVALASMVGKYVRELWMARQNRFYQTHDASLEDVSGYHDPVTQRFIAGTQRLRVSLDIIDDCFVRRAAKPGAAERQLGLFAEAE